MAHPRKCTCQCDIPVERRPFEERIARAFEASIVRPRLRSAVPVNTSLRPV
jgi:hypothetical protein